MLTSPSHLLTKAPRTLVAPIASATSGLVSTVAPKLSLILAAGSSTSLFQTLPGGEPDDLAPPRSLGMLPPRARACLCMAVAMSLHFGGYEFARSGALALFTSSEMGFSHPSAYPFAIGLVTPVSLVMLYWYSRLLKSKGPRYALRTTKLLSVSILLGATAALQALGSGNSTIWSRILVAVLFVFQNSYAHWIYSQQWSFLGSVMTPTEGTKWFSSIAGICSLVCTFTATMVHQLAESVGLLGLLTGTGVTLLLSLLLADSAYQLAELHGFDPSDAMLSKEKAHKHPDQSPEEGRSLFAKIVYMFQRVPALAALFGETISFQSLGTVLNVYFVRQLRENVSLDTDRASFTGRFYAYVNGVSAVMQFLVLPLARQIFEPKWVYRLMPLILMPPLIYAAFQSSSLMVAALGFFALKTMDYSLRNVVNEMVYQPLDFESRYLGKEVIGVFANRFGRSGMSMILSFLTPLGLGTAQLSRVAVGVGSLWSTSSILLSRLVMSNAEAELAVQQRKTKED